MKRPHSVHPSIFDLSKRLSSVALMGPPLTDKVIRLVEHLFTPEEAAVAIHLPNYAGKPVHTIAKKAKRDVDEIQPQLDSMAKKRIILRFPRKGEITYALLPIVPGIFELSLMTGGDNEWYRKYAELFEDLFSTGWIRDIGNIPLPGVKSIPVEASLPSESRVLDQDRFSELLESHEDFGVITVCQCRHTKRLIDEECKRSLPEDGCLIFGNFAQGIEEDGAGRMVSREEMRDIAEERREKGLVFMTGNVKFSSPNAICTCCDCCCGAMRAINEFGAINLVAPPHFVTSVDHSLCDDCGKCVNRCNTHAHIRVKKKHYYERSKCIGCGMCMSSCKEGAISLVENPNFVPPSENFARLGLKLAPATTLAAIKTRLAR